MGKIKDEIEYQKKKHAVKKEYLSLNFDRTIALLAASIMGCDMQNDDMGNIIISGVNIEGTTPKKISLSFDLTDEGFDKPYKNVESVKNFLTTEISRCIASDKPFDNFYDAFHTLMRDFYIERGRDDDDWQLTNSKNLVRKSMTKLKDLFNSRPDIHSVSKSLSFFTAICCLQHYNNMWKYANYNFKRETNYPLSVFNKQGKSIRPIVVGMEIEYGKMFNKIKRGLPSNSKDLSVEDFIRLETERNILTSQYNGAVDYMGFNHTIDVAIESFSNENFWHTRRLREYFKN